MQISEDLRGRGLSRVLLAAWLRMCITASLQPTTGTINKPLLALTLDRFGFEPVIRRGRQAAVDETLGDHFVLEADGEALRRALTLRGGWRSTGPLDLRELL
ncbi:hypothetical protein Ctob_015865 [Chrysochromulina tobinii]|uniref:N-acetyltransferase domain-containing protein n=1 Tax=Chrysochromulina tobinii TaxID=1460289 RepID=A0A0M0LPV4_9EUKA|nr:hypothetical protein Ctob_015865 [Chrysochromulina tobinii]|eukprot:KOO52932.1 hypothetical protein Ctob_015865 [Chrysochromulina sp. CCMP291]